jgi:hypothetical protein
MELEGLGSDEVMAKHKPGPGRPNKLGPSKLIGMRVPAATMAKIDAWARQCNIPRSEAIRTLIEIGLLAAG